MEFEYSQRFKDLVIQLHRGKENWPNYDLYIEAHLGGPQSRIARFTKYLCPEMIHHCGDLHGKRVLDFGCGTAATTAALSNFADRICAFDIDEESLEIGKLRAQEHGIEDRVTFFCADDLDKVKDQLGQFDFILVNGVIEHIPLTLHGLRKKIVRGLFDLLNEGGFLFISDTPNRLYPVDLHSTQLWWIPWTRPGSRWAYDRAVKKGRHTEVDGISPGPRGLEEVGAWGATYWEILRYLDGTSFRCINLDQGHNRHLHYSFPGSSARRLFELMVYWTLVKPFRVPITAFTPSLENLVIQKTGPARGENNRGCC